MNNQRFYTVLLLVLILGSFFHIQLITVSIALLILFMPLKRHIAAIQAAGIFTLLLAPALISLVAGYRNENYLIFKDLYYFSLPVLFITSGVFLGCRMEIPQFLKTLVVAGTAISILVSGISIYNMGLRALTDPYAAHYVIGIVGTPAPPLALACLLLCNKLHIKLFSGSWPAVLCIVNSFGIYMFASRTYLIITCCFLAWLALDYLKRPWFFAITVLIVFVLVLQPYSGLKSNAPESFISKIMGSVTEITFGDYDTEQDINTRYRGYESFMALKGYSEGTVKDWLAGGLGKLIDLKTFVKLGEDTEYQYIPILHNGWLYILVKTGLVGVLMYLGLFCTLVTVFSKKYFAPGTKPVIRLFSALAISSILSLILTNYIVSAFFSVEMSILMITLGYSYLNFHSLIFKQTQIQTEVARHKLHLNTAHR